jgi:hypothetical protein
MAAFYLKPLLSAGILSLEDQTPHLKMEAAHSPATPVKFYHTMWCHITQNGNLQVPSSKPQIPHHRNIR